jgi:signal transduction histidine kinase
VHASGGRITFTVRDSGPGIPPEQQKKIFEKFSQLETKSRQGLGLGLYISKWIVEAHGGTLSVTSKPGEGCVFTFSVSAA